MGPPKRREKDVSVHSEVAMKPRLSSEFERVALQTRYRQLVSDLIHWRDMLRQSTSDMKGSAQRSRDAVDMAATLLTESRRLAKTFHLVGAEEEKVSDLRPERLTKRERDVLRELAEG